MLMLHKLSKPLSKKSQCIVKPTWNVLQKRSLLTMPKFKFRFEDGLAPLFSSKALLDHQNTYYTIIRKSNVLIEGTVYEMMDEDDIVMKSGMAEGEIVMHAYVADVFNHRFFFQCLTPKPSPPSKKLLAYFDLHFDGIDNFKKIFKSHAMALHGSGYTWLIKNEGKWTVTNSFNSQTPAAIPENRPLLALDLWEHSYYPDWKDDREGYIEAWWNQIDWEFVESNIDIPIRKDLV